MFDDLQVIIISTRIDLSTDAVVRELDRLGVNCIRFNTDTYPFESTLSAFVSPGETRVTLQEGDRESVPLNTASGIWFRRIRTPRAPENVNPNIHEYCINEARASLIGSLIGVRSRIMSHPLAIWRAEHKVEQLRVASEIGFTIPLTTVTNDPEKVRIAYSESGGRLIVKPVRRGYVCLGDNDERAVYTSLVKEEHLDRVASAQMAPSIYQHLIEKSCDIRVTYVDGTTFVAEIDSQSDPDAEIDWRRTSNPMLPHRATELPPSITQLIIKLMTKLELRFGAIDLVRTPGGEYVFLEVNPNGQWLWLEEQLGFRISKTIAGWLAGVQS